MHSNHLNVAAFGLLASLTAPAHAYWRMGCPGTLVTERLDPIVDAGKASGHAHIILGGNGFAPTMTYESTQASTCTSCSIKGDYSNYWVPNMYYHAQNGSFISVPTEGGTVYYQQRVTYPGKTLKAFPAGLRMTAGNPELRSYNATEAQEAISHVCLNYAGGGPPQGPALPTVNCPDGVRSQVYFPSCWDGVNLDSANHQSHMSYPVGGAPDSGVCPDSHPNPLISIFFEFIFSTGDFANEWYGSQQPFVFSMGDNSGYGFHGDFINGWDIDLLQNAVDNFVTTDAGDADNVYYNNYFQAPDVMGTQCSAIPMIDEQVLGLLPALPGCNPVTDNPVPVTDCSATTILAPDYSSIYTDVTKTLGWSYLGCGTDVYGNPALGDAVEDSPTMTVETCINLCSSKGHAIAGLEYGSQCMCGDSIPARASPTPNVVGACTEACKGNASEICGNANALSLYTKCGSTCTNAQFGSPGLSSSGSTGSSGSSAVSVAPVASSTAEVSSVASSTTLMYSVVASSSSATASPTLNTNVVKPVNPIATATSVAPVAASGLPSTVTLPSGWSSAGCYSDALNPRSLSGITFAWWGSAMTSSGCAKYCDAQGYSMAGTENGGQCFCGNSLVQSTLESSSDCNTACEGSATEICGGPARLSVFKKSGSSSSSRIRKRSHVHGRAGHHLGQTS